MEAESLNEIADALTNAFTDQSSCRYDPITVQDSILELAKSAKKIAVAVTPFDTTCGGDDAAGGHVCSLTESVMGVTAGLCKIADAIERLADSVESLGKK